MNLTEKQLDILRHMLGINTPNDRIPKPYRNYACVNPGDSEFVELEKLGAIERYETWDKDTQYYWYKCTVAGRLAAMRSHRKIRKSKPKRRYSAYLNMIDCCPDLTFKEFLTHPHFKDVRNNA